MPVAPLAWALPAASPIIVRESFGFFRNAGFLPMSMAITALPVATASASSESWRPEPPRARFRTAWEASYGPAPTGSPSFVGWRLQSGAGFLAQAIAATAPSEMPAEVAGALARYQQAAMIDDRIRSGDPVFFRATL